MSPGSQTKGLQISDRQSTSCEVAERHDHHCGDDHVNKDAQKQSIRDYISSKRILQSNAIKKNSAQYKLNDYCDH